MRRDEHVQPHFVGQPDSNAAMVATFAAVLVAAGSAYYLRFRRRAAIVNEWSSPRMVPSSATSFPDEPASAALLTPENGTVEIRIPEEPQADESQEQKQARSKERRRRGKDPFKELLKGGKKTNKLIAKLGKLPSVENDQNRRSDSSLPEQIQRAERVTPDNSPGSSDAHSSPSPTTRDFKADTTIASSSSPSSSDNNSIAKSAVKPSADSSSALDYSVSSNRAESSVSSSPPPRSDSSLPLNDDEGKEAGSSALSTPDIVQSPITSSELGSALPASHSLFPFDANEPPNIASSHSMPAYYSSFSPTAGPSPTKSNVDTKRQNPHPTQRVNSPWDWESQSQGPSNHEATYQKPPRFRSKSRVSSSSSISISGPMSPYGMSFPQINPYSHVNNPLSSSPPSLVTPHPVNSTEPPRPFTFPSLNSPSPSQSPAPSLNGFVNSSPALNGHGANRRTPAPQASSSSSLGGSESATPQSASHVASLKAELDAARMGETKYRQQAEHYAKEYESLRWRWTEDTAAWRRREVELQHQMHHLMHQLQTYATAYMCNPPTPTSSRLQVPYLPHQFSPPSPRHPLSASLQMLSPNGPSSPSQHARTPSPFFAYAPQSPTQSQPPSQHQSNLLSLLLTTGSAASSVRTVHSGASSASAPTSASVSDSSSVGSISPQLDASPLRDRGRQRTRVPAQDDDADDEWVVSAPNGNGDDVSELLAGAILKHPESLRVRPKASQEQKRESPKATEFTFPSISTSLNGESVTESEDDVFQSKGA